MYLLLFLIGVFGFTAMTALGFLSHGGHDGGHGHGHGHGGHGHSHGHGPLDHLHIPEGPATSHQMPIGPRVSGARGPTASGARAGSRASFRGFKGARSRSSTWWAISPLDIFSLSLGAGAVGLLGERQVQASWLILLAVFGAILFNYALVKPVMGFLGRFASPPSEGLEGMVAQNGVAVTKFDEKGRGLVKVVLDGQETQILAGLDQDEVLRGVRVQRGDSVTILEVDPVHNTCRVTRELAA